LWSILPAGSALAGQWLRAGLGLAALVAAVTAARGAEPAAPLQLRAEGSFPLQYIESVTSRSRQNNSSVAPYLGLMATAHLQSDLTTAIFAIGGHNQLGSFADGDNTLASVGANLVKHWGALRAGISLEHTRYFDDAFGTTTNIGNDVNVFASYLWKPNPGLQIRPSATLAMRADEAFAVQRYSYGARIDIEQRLSGPWWLVASSRLRRSDYVGSEAGRRDTRLAIVAGVKYQINESVEAKILAGFENRASTIASRASDKFVVGASIDFDIDFMRPRWPGSR
jgi:hypothetical protein